MNSVVKLKDKGPRPGTVDLRQDNRIGDLLDEYEYAARVCRDAQKEKAALAEEIEEKLGDAKSALVNGWILKRSSWTRKQYVVKAGVVSRLVVERKPKLATQKNEWRDYVSQDEAEDC